MLPKLFRAAEIFFWEYSCSTGPFTVEMAILFLATFASEDLACISAGVLVAQGRLTYLMAVLACFLGIFAGDMLAFLVGRMAGLRTPGARWLSRWIAPENRSDAQQWVQKRGASAVFISRFIPGIRVATYFSAGLLNMKWPNFVLSLAAATVIWVPLIVSATNLFGEKILAHLLNNFSSAILAIALSFLLLFMLRNLIPKVSLRARSR
jgi:membrane protein DedA with SNARE-associated domain